MKTIVFQSFRTENVPGYIAPCLESVRTWARSRGHHYHFIDDRFLSLVPDSYRSKAGNLLCLVTDLARIIQARAFLQQGFEQVIWMDADLFIFQPERLQLPVFPDFRYCKEVWLHRAKSGEIYPAQKVNNSVCIFGPDGLRHLDEYIQHCTAVFESTEALTNGLVMATEVLTRSYQAIENIRVIGILSPALLQAVLLQEENVLAQYIAWQGSPIFAVNLCNMLREGFTDAPGLFDYLLVQALSSLKGSSGHILAGDRSKMTKANA